MAQQAVGGMLIAAGVIFGGIYLTQVGGGFNEPAPNFSLPEVYGARVDLASYRGQPVLLVFWTTSCGICRRELPLLNRMSREFRTKGVNILAINLGDRDEARDYMRSNHLDLTTLADADGQVARAYNVSGVPKLVLVDEEGLIRRSSSGMTGESDLREWISTDKSSR